MSDDPRGPGDVPTRATGYPGTAVAVARCAAEAEPETKTMRCGICRGERVFIVSPTTGRAYCSQCGIAADAEWRR